jgi:hypothetical protein
MEKKAYAYREGGLLDSEGRGAGSEGEGGDETEHGLHLTKREN